MPDIFFMFVCFALLVVVWGFALLLHFLSYAKEMTNKAALAAFAVYLIERFKK